MFCRYCGSEQLDSAKFCVNCGASLERKNPEPPNSSPQNEPIYYNSFPNQGVPPTPPSGPGYGSSAKKPGRLNVLLLIIIIVLVIGVGINIFQFFNGTHIFTGNSSRLSNYKSPDASYVSQTEEWGNAPINQLILVFEDHIGKNDKKNMIKQLGGVIVGELETINLYQIEVQSRSEAELSALIDTALSLDGVESAFPNVELYSKGLEGTPCSPLSDPVFSDPNNASHYKAIGMEDAWRIIKSSGISLNKVKAGVLDSAVYVGSGEYNGKVKLDGDQTSEPEKNQNNAVIDGGLNHGTMVTNVIGADHENGGMVGIAAILEEKLSIKVRNLYDGKTSVPAAYDESDITQATYRENGVNYTYTMKALVYLKEQVDMLSAVQRDGSVLHAREIYEATWQWLDERGCSALVSPQLLERYSMAAGRWIHCEEIITNTGYLAKHPTTGMAIASPYVSMSQNYMSQTNRLWSEIYGIVRENCATDYSGHNPQDDVNAENY